MDAETNSIKKPSYDELNKAYESAMQGSCTPTAFWYSCPDCKESYFVTSSTDPNILCEHLLKLLGKSVGS